MPVANFQPAQIAIGTVARSAHAARSPVLESSTPRIAMASTIEATTRKIRIAMLEPIPPAENVDSPLLAMPRSPE